ncbi:PAS domain S-box protein [Undibacterium sp. Di26W]|uniref:PAS domain S-box protein n=1 Tax=Undibacterium sp. Di26W TaxID=3413035 RepID=UPI003BF0D0B1
MQAPALPNDETIRLQTLQACAILDTPAEERFDRLTRLARHLFQTPMALVSLIDTDRLWFKSHQGMDAVHVPRDISFCGHAILSHDVLYVPDTRLDLRFSDNPLVTDAPHIRFYAGAPLRARNGQRLGTLCIMDNVPRTLSQDDLTALRDLADCVEHEFSREEQQRQHHALLALTEITSLSYQDPENLLRQALEMACDYLGISTGHIVKIEDGMCEIILRQSGDDRFHEGEKIPLTKSFAALTLASNTVFHIADVFDSPYLRHPGYTQLGVVCYISVTLYMNERQYGTLNFSDVHARLFPFSDVEIEFVRLLGDWVSGVLKRQELDRQLQQQRLLSDAIAKTQVLFISESDQEKGFESLLTATLNLSASECGFISEVFHDKQGELVLKSTVLAWNTNDELTVGTPLVQEVQDQLSQHLTTLFAAQENAAQTPLLLTPELAKLDIIFPEHLRPLNNFLGIPVHYDGELIAIVGIANRQHDAKVDADAEAADKYADDALIAFLNPLFSTLGQLISAARVQKHRYETERQLANVIKGTNIGTWECNILTGETIYNERWAEMLGYTLAELSPTTVNTWLNLCHPEDLKVTSALIEQHFRGEIEYFDLKSRMRHKDGRWIWIHDRGCVVSWSPDGQPLIMSGSHADITTQKEAEAELEHAYELLEKSNAAARIGTWELDAQTRELHWSKVTRQIHEVDDDFSCTVEHAISFYKDESYQKKITQMVGDALREGKAFDTELCIVTARGNERCVHVIGFPQFEDNVCLRLYGTFQDISERKAAEESLRDHAAHTSTIVDNVLDGIITLNEDEYILSVNNAAANIFGYDIDDLPGQHIRQLMPQVYAAPAVEDAAVTDSKQDQEEQQANASSVKDMIGIGREITGRKKDGSLFPLDVSMSAVKRQGKPLYIGLIRDITERKRIEQIKNEFISTVSHELRTPLTSISGALGLISGGVLGKFPDRIQQMLDIAIKNCLRLTFLINDLLDMEKLSAGKMVFHFQTVALSEILMQAIESNQTFGAQRHVSLYLARSVPAVSVSVDTQRFMQVLSNLLSNAIKYSPENGTVEITATANERRVRINVIDHGAGVPNEFRDRIFQKFAQADSSDTRQNGGTGLGLAITRELVERMDGNIGFESRPGRGAKFYIDLPISPKEPATS